MIQCPVTTPINVQSVLWNLSRRTLRLSSSRIKFLHASLTVSETVHLRSAALRLLTRSLYNSVVHCSLCPEVFVQGLIFYLNACPFLLLSLSMSACLETHLNVSAIYFSEWPNCCCSDQNIFIYFRTVLTKAIKSAFSLNF